MIVDVKVPSVGESVSEGVLASWTVSNGDFVEKGSTLFELDTDKATTDVPAPESGTVEHVVEEGAEVTVDSVVAKINTDGEGSSDSANEEEDDSGDSSDSSESKESASNAEENGKAVSDESDEKILATPLAKKIAADKNISLSEVTGTGASGRITRDDVENHTQRKSSKSLEKPTEFKKLEKSKNTSEDGEDQTREKMSMLRRRIAERLVSAQHNAAMLTTFNDVDMSAVMNLRKEYKEKFEKRHGVKLGFMSFFARAAVEALKDFPLVNAFIDGNEIVHNHRYHIGIAVSTEKGLTVPVIRNVDQMSFAEIENSVVDYAVKARDGKLELDDLQGGTFTITNGGVFGSMLSTPILNPPQSAILGMHRIEQRPVVVDGEVVVRPMMYLALSYDHRIIDGKEAVSFLVKIKDCIENPTRMLLDI